MAKIKYRIIDLHPIDALYDCRHELIGFVVTKGPGGFFVPEIEGYHNGYIEFDPPIYDPEQSHGSPKPWDKIYFMAVKLEEVK